MKKYYLSTIIVLCSFFIAVEAHAIIAQWDVRFTGTVEEISKTPFKSDCYKTRFHVDESELIGTLPPDAFQEGGTTDLFVCAREGESIDALSEGDTISFSSYANETYGGNTGSMFDTSSIALQSIRSITIRSSSIVNDVTGGTIGRADIYMYTWIVFMIIIAVMSGWYWIHLRKEGRKRGRTLAFLVSAATIVWMIYYIVRLTFDETTIATTAILIVIAVYVLTWGVRRSKKPKPASE